MKNVDDTVQEHILDIQVLFPGQLVISPKQFAQLRGKSQITLHRERVSGTGPPFKEINGKPVYLVRTVAKWLSQENQTA